MADLVMTGADPGVIARLDAYGRRFAVSRRRLLLALRVARTIADLEGASGIAASHVDEALSYRPVAVAP
jgi:predicted ATPase with chaperone activity